MELVLASLSPYRRQLLERLGVPFTTCAHASDERAGVPGYVSADDVARAIARDKAMSVADRYPQAYILGSDQVVDVDGTILGKPGTVEAALNQLAQLQGRVHRLITAVALWAPDGSLAEAVAVHRMRMRPLTEAEQRRYIEAEMPLDCCGAYKIEGRGIALFEAIEGADFTAIIGLPMLSVVSMLRCVGFAIP